MKLHVGDWVEVRSKEEVLGTLDNKGRLDMLPFMPQMFQYCGQRFRVYKRAHKTCDTVNYHRGGGRWLSNGIHLETRCDGEAYGGCQAACLIFWKEAWLKPVDEKKCLKPYSSVDTFRNNEQSALINLCTEADVQAGTYADDLQDGEETRYACQATLLPSFTTYLAWWDFRQYLEDYTSGNATLGRLFRGFVYAAYFSLCKHSWRAYRLRRFYDWFQSVRGGLPYPRWAGAIPAGQPTPICNLNIRPGELVRVKLYNEILSTLDTNNKNRGMKFDAEMVPCCGGTYRVRNRVEKFIDEKTGKISSMKTPAIILEKVWCQASYSDCRMGCPRSIYSWWREIWLERVPASNSSQSSITSSELTE